MKICLKKLKENAMLPVRGSEYAAGYDLHACLDAPVRIPPHETVKIGTGISAAIPAGRSTFGSLTSSGPANTMTTGRSAQLWPALTPARRRTRRSVAGKKARLRSCNPTCLPFPPPIV